ncbi:GNAT family N-acetyltransferase [Gynuella sunshinyii]|uniref:Acetyltransferase n=1 Tax=Gynuella sunshinyii YC6258 TaxID=1445510 RepID=A0A0C5V6K2_9GAMM|nr:GNAT family N-acetyltransferase [Gynuella sunshinyii]AJQ95080.1 acetyltransferase [Gynuella sunshinyii YC6258]
MNIREFDYQNDISLYVSGDIEAFKESFPGITIPSILKSEIEHGFKSFCINDFNCAYTAVENEKPVGFVVVSIHYFYMIPQGYIESIYVDSDHRGNGISHELINKATEWARSKGANTIRLDVSLTNEIAISAYQKNGFIQTRIQMEKFT